METIALPVLSYVQESRPRSISQEVHSGNRETRTVSDAGLTRHTGFEGHPLTRCTLGHRRWTHRLLPLPTPSASVLQPLVLTVFFTFDAEPVLMATVCLIPHGDEAGVLS